MGYELFDDGFHLRLDRELPQKLMGAVPERVAQFLKQYNLTTKDIAHWLFHPGGIKILDYLENGFNLKPVQCHWARDVLSQNGNMSSATVLYVLKAFLDSRSARSGDKALMLGVGPGLTVELILFEWIEG